MRRPHRDAARPSRSSDYPADMTSETADTAGAPGTVEAPATVAPSPPAPQHLVLTLSCPDRPGIVHAVSGALARRGGARA